jgi:hypothetical protein
MKQVVRRRIGIATGLALAVAVVTVLSAPGCEHLHARGPMNVGHAEVACGSCHRAAPGSLRQQLQTVARTWTGIEERASVDVGFQQVSNRECTQCHDNREDRHAASRFLEPRFAAARAAIKPDRCDSCHREHAGMRVTTTETTFCRHCHGELVVKQDPIDVPHADLVAGQRWETCLGCHDFHGSHPDKPQRRLADAIPLEQIESYFAGGASPYTAPTKRTNMEVVSR